MSEERRQGCPLRLTPLRLMSLLSLALASASCSSRPADTEDDRTPVVLGPAVSGLQPAAEAIAKPTNTTDPPIFPRSDIRAYAVPPLPPELQDDGDLIPLPPRPSPTELAKPAPPPD